MNNDNKRNQFSLIFYVTKPKYQRVREKCFPKPGRKAVDLEIREIWKGMGYDSRKRHGEIQLSLNCLG